jgi:hypothetical protein
MNESKHIHTRNVSKHHHDQKIFATKRIMNSANHEVNKNQSSEPSYGDYDGPKIMTLK